MKKQITAVLTAAMLACLPGCSQGTSASAVTSSGSASAASAEVSSSSSDSAAAQIEAALDLSQNAAQTWTYNASADAWTLSVVSAVVNPEIPDEQGVSVCVPGAYVTGIDTNGDKTADVTAAAAASAVTGCLVINYDARVTSPNGQVYTAATAPVIVNTGAAGYSSQSNQTAASTYAADGYINVACGNRGKQDTVTDSSGNTSYTGDAPCCLVDQKNAVRFVKYNILLGNLPGSTDYFVSTGGSGGAAHAAMLAATSNNADFYPYEAEAGAVGVYALADGSYSTAVTIRGTAYALSDGVWGCVAYSAITSLAEADMDMAFEYYLNTAYDFNTSFQKQLAQYLSAEYKDYINGQNLSVAEAAVGFDLNGDGDQQDTIALTIDYDAEKYADTNGYGGTYLTLYLDEFKQNLQWYLDNLDYADGWTWFGTDGSALSDAEVAAMTSADKAQAFLEGRYAKSDSSGSTMGNAAGGAPAGGTAGGNAAGGAPTGGMPGGNTTGGTMPGGNMPGSTADSSAAAGSTASDTAGTAAAAAAPSADTSGMGTAVGTPGAGTTQSAGMTVDSSNYASYSDMLSAYEKDIAEIQAGDEYGNNIVSLYNPLNYIGAEGTENPTWTRIMMGAAEGDMSMFASLNLQLAWLNAGTDAVIQWQWDGGHVPSEVLGESLALYVDEMYGKYVSGAVSVEKAAAVRQTVNGTASAATGKNLTSWVSMDQNGKVTFSLAAAAAYRTAGASKATPGFDVLDYGQEDYVFGSSSQDARHWDSYLLRILQEQKDTLSALFNANS